MEAAQDGRVFSLAQFRGDFGSRSGNMRPGVHVRLGPTERCWLAIIIWEYWRICLVGIVSCEVFSPVIIQFLVGWVAHRGVSPWPLLVWVCCCGCVGLYRVDVGYGYV
jgi:hypothetical protein